MTIRVGIFNQNLSQIRPRGVVRVARAITERLALRGDLEIHAISEPFFDLGDMLVKAFPINAYLETVPLDLSLVAKKVPVAHYFLMAIGWAVLRPVPTRIARKLASSLGMFEKGRKIYRRMYESRQQVLGSGGRDLGALEMEIPHSTMALDAFDVVLGFEVYENAWKWPLENSRARAICFIHDAIPLRIDEGPYGRPDRFFRRTATAVLRSDHLICNSQATAKDVAAFFPAGAEKLTVVHLGHDIDRFRSGDGSVSGRKLRQRILMVGDIDNRKNLQGMLRALAYVKERLPERPLELVIVGNQQQRGLFRTFEKAASQYASITWTGYVPDQDLSRHYREADVFVFPSLWEGFGIPVLEAMSAGIPVVCSDLASLPEVGGSHVTYCDPYDPSSIGNAVADVLLMDETERADRIEAAKKWASGFTWDVTAARIVDVFRKVGCRGCAGHS